jgi:pyruvate dehydrogenase E1 component beta subunit
VDEEVDCDYFILTQLHPLPIGMVADSVSRTGRLLSVEEGVTGFGLGAELAASLVEDGKIGSFSFRRVGARPVPIPASQVQEQSVLPSKEGIVQAMRALLHPDR